MCIENDLKAKRKKKKKNHEKFIRSWMSVNVHAIILHVIDTLNNKWKIKNKEKFSEILELS